MTKDSKDSATPILMKFSHFNRTALYWLNQNCHKQQNMLLSRDWTVVTLRIHISVKSVSLLISFCMNDRQEALTPTIISVF